MAQFIGFTTQGLRTGSKTLEDATLAKRDLLNHFYTRRGERLGEPEFGSILPFLVFEPNDLLVRDAVDDDVRNIIASDPRWELISYTLTNTDHSIEVEVQLQYVPGNTQDLLQLNYTSQEEI